MPISNTKTNHIKINSSNLLSKVRRYLENRDAQYRYIYNYLNSNEEEIVTPFLDALRVDYRYLNKDLVIVKETEGLINKLKELNFISRNELPKNKQIQKKANITKDYLDERFYNSKYRIDLHIIKAKDWNKAILTIKVMSSINMHNKDSNFVKKFCSIYKILGY